MYKMCKTEQSALRQRQLEQGLLQAMLVRQYEEISVSDLCDQLELPRKSFYRYFSGKEGALHALIDHTLLEYESFPMPEAAGESAEQQELERFFRFWQSQRELLNALERSGLMGELVTRTIETARSVLGVSDRLQAREQAVIFGVCGLMHMMLQWHREGFATAPGKMAAIAISLMTKPLIPQME